MNLLAWLIIALGCLAVWHFMYEVILLPSCRQALRFKLFSLRDRLRTLKTESSWQISDEAFHLLDDALSWQMKNQAKLTFTLMVESGVRAKRDNTFAAQIRQRNAQMDSCRHPEYRAIKKEAADLSRAAILCNSSGWMVYLIPPAMVCASMAKLAEAAKLLLGAPQRELDRMGHCPA